MTKNEQINNIRAYFIQNRMFSELRGFNAGVRMFDDKPKHEGMRPVRTTRTLPDGTIETSTQWVPIEPTGENSQKATKLTSPSSFYETVYGNDPTYQFLRGHGEPPAQASGYSRVRPKHSGGVVGW
jgi:hypothetical protein